MGCPFDRLTDMVFGCQPSSMACWRRSVRVNWGPHHTPRSTRRHKVTSAFGLRHFPIDHLLYCKPATLSPSTNQPIHYIPTMAHHGPINGVKITGSFFFSFPLFFFLCFSFYQFLESVDTRVRAENWRLGFLVRDVWVGTEVVVMKHGSHLKRVMDKKKEAMKRKERKRATKSRERFCWCWGWEREERGTSLTRSDYSFFFFSFPPSLHPSRPTTPSTQPSH